MRRSLFQPVFRAVFTLLVSMAGAGAPIRAGEHEATERFDAEIAPLLARRCLECHNSADKKGGLDLTHAETAMEGGDSGTVIESGNLDESYLWERISNDEMPPKKPLADEEKELLRAWIDAGAAWGSGSVDRFKYTTDIRAGYDWWALQPVRRPDTPTTKTVGWRQNAIDAFILERLEAHEPKLNPSPMADRRTLVRRLSFDLIGLPPSPEEVAAFVADADPAAYERLVDRLLASPHYGERWGRHWLDLARFGESHGFEHDEPRPNAWPYRDWVIAALNADMPFDQFAKWQLAGDVLAPHDRSAITATGFLVAGAFDSVGQTQSSDAMRAVVRQDELEDIVGTVGQTFLGLTVNCARCHDHKFDPIRQTEYYRLTSAVGGVRHGERELTPPENHQQPGQRNDYEQRVAAAKVQIAAINQKIAAIDEPIRRQILADRSVTSVTPPTPIARWDFDADLNDGIGSLHGTAQAGAVANGGGLHLDGKAAFVATVPLAADLRGKTLEAWVLLGNLQQRGGGAISIQTLDGVVFDAIVFGEREPGAWMAGSDGFSRYQSFGGPPEDLAEKASRADKQPVHVAIVYDENGTITGYRNGQPYGKPYKSTGPVTFKAGAAQVVFGLRHSLPAAGKMLAGVIDRAQLYDRPLAPDEVAASAGVASNYVAPDEIVARLRPAAADERRRLEDELEGIEALNTSAGKVMTYAVSPREPETTHLLVRGDFKQPTDVLSAGGVGSVVGVAADFGLAPDAPEKQRRAALAEWVANSKNPLFARVIVNRLWHYHFGVGLVDTPNDFGFNGGRPSHPELLDWLAAELIDGGWSLKRLHRTIVMSAAYRQRSAPNAEALAIDTDNRLLWRKSPHRLEAEAVRDATLAVAGELNPQMEGPPFHDFRIVDQKATFVYELIDPVGERFNRRSVYRMWARGGRSGLLDAFDCPDPSTTAPKRAVTTTPLQALVMMNNSFVLRMADRFGERIERKASTDTDVGPSPDPSITQRVPGRGVADAEKQIVRAYELAYGRRPSDEELRLATAIVEKHGLAVLARAIFNSNEFLYVD